MIKACKDANKKLMIAYRCHYEPTNLRAMQLIREGKLGKIQAIESANGFNAKAWRVEARPQAGRRRTFDGYGRLLAERVPLSNRGGTARDQSVRFGH